MVYVKTNSSKLIIQSFIVTLHNYLLYESLQGFGKFIQKCKRCDNSMGVLSWESLKFTKKWRHKHKRKQRNKQTYIHDWTLSTPKLYPGKMIPKYFVNSPPHEQFLDSAFKRVNRRWNREVHVEEKMGENYESWIYI